MKRVARGSGRRKRYPSEVQRLPLADRRTAQTRATDSETSQRNRDRIVGGTPYSNYRNGAIWVPVEAVVG